MNYVFIIVRCWRITIPEQTIWNSSTYAIKFNLAWSKSCHLRDITSIQNVNSRLGRTTPLDSSVRVCPSETIWLFFKPTANRFSESKRILLIKSFQIREINQQQIWTFTSGLLRTYVRGLLYLSVERAERTGCDGLSLRNFVHRSPLAVKLGNQQKPMMAIYTMKQSVFTKAKLHENNWK